MAENIPERPRRKPNPVEPELPKAPRHLTAASRRLWDAIVAEWRMTPDGLLLLEAGLDQWDLYVQTRKQVRKEKPVVVNPSSGNPKPHPGVRIMNDALTQCRLAFRQLGLTPPEEG